MDWRRGRGRPRGRGRRDFGVVVAFGSPGDGDATGDGLSRGDGSAGDRDAPGVGLRSIDGSAVAANEGEGGEADAPSETSVEIDPSLASGPWPAAPWRALQPEAITAEARISAAHPLVISSHSSSPPPGDAWCPSDAPRDAFGRADVAVATQVYAGDTPGRPATEDAAGGQDGHAVRSGMAAVPAVARTLDRGFQVRFLARQPTPLGVWCADACAATPPRSVAGGAPDEPTPSPSRAPRLHPRHRRRGPRGRPRRNRRHALPARAQRLPPHRPREVDLPELRHRAEFGGRCNLRFDDTNPVKEEQEYIDAIEADVRWLGFDWGDNLFHASDYFEQLYAWAVHLIEQGLAFVDDQTADEIRETRGTLTEPGTNSPFRDRSVDENLDLFARMRAGEFPNGARVLRAKIDMASPNMNLRDPVLYRIVHATHPRTGDAWCIYPTYDFAHGQSDAIEGVTHSICTLEFENHRPLYDWLIEHLPVPSRPHQYEFARLNLTHTVLSKRVLLRLVDEGHVRGWDDPRMPTICRPPPARLPGRGHPQLRDDDRRRQDRQPSIEFALLEHAVRDGAQSDVAAAVRRPRPDQGRHRELPRGPGRGDGGRQQPRGPVRRDAQGRRSGASCGSSATTSSRSRRRSSSGSRRAARSACGTPYFITCTEVIKDADGTRRRAPLHVRPGDARRRLARRSAPQGDAPLGLGRARDPGRGPPVRPPVRPPDPGADGGPVRRPEPRVRDDRSRGAYVEPALADAAAGEAVQFERLGYFVADPDTAADRPVWTRTLTLKDTWAKVQARG